MNNNKKTKGLNMEIKIGDKLELNWEHDNITVDVIDIDACERGLITVDVIGSTHCYEMSGDEDLGQFWGKATIISVKGGK